MPDMIKPSIHFTYKYISEDEIQSMTFVSLFHSAKQKELSLDHQGAFFGIPGGIQVSRGDYRVYREYKTSITV